MRVVCRFLLATLLWALALPLSSHHAAALGAGWQRPVNLSLSGSASGPVLVQGDARALYVYWWDQFDGLTFAQLGEAGWQAPQPVPLTDVSLDAQGQPVLDRDTGAAVRTTVRGGATLIGAGGRVHAFFLAPGTGGTRPLRYANAPAGSAAWSAPRTLAPGATAWRAAASADGSLHLVVMFPARAAGRQPGLYYLRSGDGGVTWSDLIPIAESLYVRMATQPGTHLQLLPTPDGRIFLAWNEPGTNRALYTWSWNAGASWARPRLVDADDRTATNTQFSLVGDGSVLMVWQGTNAAGEQTLMMRRSPDGGWNWTAPERFAPALRARGAQVTLEATPDGRVLLVAGAQPNGPLLASYQPGAADGTSPPGWSDVLALSYPVRDLDAQAAASVGRWHVLAGDAGLLYLAGLDEWGDVWLLSADLQQVAWAYPRYALWGAQATLGDTGWTQPAQLASSGVVVIPAGEAIRLAQLPAASIPQPVLGEVESPPAEPLRYVVQEGDTLSGLAERFGVPTAELAAANAIAPTALLTIGQELLIPGQTAEGPAAEAAPAQAAQPAPGPTPPALWTVTPGQPVGPQVITAANGKMQAFWWDLFNGLTSAWYDGEVWLQAQHASAYVPTTGQAAPPQVPPIGAQFLGDGAGRVHAFWLASAEGQDPALWHSMLGLGQHVWSEPTLLGPAFAWTTAVGPEGGLLLATLRGVAGGTPGGLYLQTLPPGGDTWSPVRLLQALEQPNSLSERRAPLALAAHGSHVFAAWEAPGTTDILWARSSDGGQTWTGPNAVGVAQRDARAPLIAALDGEALLLFQATRADGVPEMYQVRIPAEGQPPTPAVPVPAELDLSQGNGSSRLVTLDERAAVLVSGLGADRLTVATWRAQGSSDSPGAWSSPQTLGFGPAGPQRGAPGEWGYLQLALSIDRATVLGVGPQGDLHALSRPFADEDWAQHAPAGWLPAERIGEVGPLDQELALAADDQGRVHALWSAREDPGGPSVALWYARHADGGWTRPIAVLQPQEGRAEMPSLAIVGERLHAVWSAGIGRILYASSFAADAHSAAGWSRPAWLPAPALGRDGVAIEPQIRADLLGRLHVVYAVPINQGRGIYYTRSEDGGQSWSEPRVVFDATAADWAMVGEPALAIGHDGTLHVAWLRKSLVDGARGIALYLSRSLNGGESWSEARLIAEGHLAEPVLLATNAQEIHLLWHEAGSGGYTLWQSYTRSNGADWSLPARIRGWTQLSGRGAAATDGVGHVYLVGVQRSEAGRLQLLPASWDAALEQWRTDEGQPLPPDVASVAVARLSLAPLAGRLDAVLHVQSSAQADVATQAALLHLRREVDSVSAPPEPVAGLAAAPVAAQPMPTVQPTPTPRPTVRIDAPPPGEGSIPVGTLAVPVLSLGGVVVVALLVVGVLIARGARRR